MKFDNNIELKNIIKIYKTLSTKIHKQWQKCNFEAFQVLASKIFPIRSRQCWGGRERLAKSRFRFLEKCVLWKVFMLIPSDNRFVYLHWLVAWISWDWKAFAPNFFDIYLSTCLFLDDFKKMSLLINLGMSVRWYVCLRLSLKTLNIVHWFCIYWLRYYGAQHVWVQAKSIALVYYKVEDVIRVCSRNNARWLAAQPYKTFHVQIGKFKQKEWWIDTKNTK